jgi:putative peptidoglycan lipid II flippase
MLDWGLRLVVLLAVPCAMALLVFSKPLVARCTTTAPSPIDVRQTTAGADGLRRGPAGLVAIKVLAPGYYASQDIRTPVRIAIVVLVITQLLNLLLCAAAAARGAGAVHWRGCALINAAGCWSGCTGAAATGRSRAGGVPAAGGGRHALLAVFLMWAAEHLPGQPCAETGAHRPAGTWSWSLRRGAVLWRRCGLAGLRCASCCAADARCASRGA